MILFPSSLQDKGEFGLIPVKVNGTYAESKNESEARVLVTQAISFIKNNPDKSLGLVAINVKQKELIEDLFNEEVKNHPDIKEYIDKWESKYEGFFIKNLENVQGDERDAIFISLVYGLDAGGNFSNNFGPISKDKGDRRLNVLFSRAKCLMKIFYSMSEGDIKISATAKDGSRCLKSFINFLDTGILLRSTSSSSGGNEHLNSVFEDFVVEELEKEGFAVERQIGESGFFIDMAIKDVASNSYILGIECDGRTYHSSKYMRDRDKTRQKMLENLGWKIARIWSTDWFKNPKKEIEKIKNIVNHLNP